MRGKATRVGAPGALDVARWALTLALAAAALARVGVVQDAIEASAQGAGARTAALVVVLAPTAIYAAAVVLSLSRRGGPSLWVILLACGLALAAVTFFRAGSEDVWRLALGPSCLVALSLLVVLSRGSASTAATR
jgi:hypothetical protein